MTRTIAFIASALLVACDGEPRPPLVASDVVINRPLPGSTVGAAFLELTNSSEQPITITRVASPQFESVEAHETIITDGVTRMRPVAALSILPGQSIRLEPGGRHLMLSRAVAELKTVTLQFFSDDALIISLDVNIGSSLD